MDSIYVTFLLQEAFAASVETGVDLEHVEVLQKKFDEFQKVRHTFNLLETSPEYTRAGVNGNCIL